MSRTERTAAVCAVVLLFAAFLRFPDLASRAARDAVGFAARRLIPSLFPAMTLSSLLLRLGQGCSPPRFVSKLLRLPGKAAWALLLGWAAGFPAGAAAAAKLKQDGAISRRDAECLAAVSGAPGPAFFIAALGGMWDCPELGGFLLFLHLLTMLVLCRLLFRHGASGAFSSSRARGEAFFPALGGAVSDAGSACVTVAASVVFFRALCAVLSRLFPPLSPLFLLTFEFSAGAARGAEIGGLGGAMFSGFAVGFSGLAVFCQIARPLSEAGLGLRRALAVRLICGISLALGSAAFFLLHPLAPSLPSAAAPTAFFTRETLPGAVLLAVSVLAQILSRRSGAGRRAKIPSLRGKFFFRG